MKKWQQNILILIISVILVCLVGELYLRLLDFNKPLKFYLIPSVNEKLVYELDPRSSEINSFGMRQDNFREEDLSDAYVIAAIGDSHTYSLGVNDWYNSYPKKLEHYLDTLSNGRKVRVLNFGVSGYNTAQELEVFKSKALQFHPDLVVLQITINDTHVCNLIQPKYKFINQLIYKSKLLVFCWKKFLYSDISIKYLYNWFEKYLPDSLFFQEGLVGTRDSNIKGELPAHLNHPARTKDRVPLRYHYMLGEENWKKHIYDFVKIARIHNIPIIATGFIENWQRAVLLSEGIKIYTFDEIFGVIDENKYGYIPSRTGTHFNEAGCDVIGKNLAGFIFNLYLRNERKIN